MVVPANPAATIGAAVKSGAIDKADLRTAAEFLLARAQTLCSELKAPTSSPASGVGEHDADLLRIARGLNEVLKRA